MEEDFLDFSSLGSEISYKSVIDTLTFVMGYLQMAKDQEIIKVRPNILWAYRIPYANVRCEHFPIFVGWALPTLQAHPLRMA